MNRILRRIGGASARRPWRTIGAWAFITVLVAALSGALGGAFVDDFTAPGSDSAEAMALLEERFPEAAGGTAVAVFAAEEGQRLDRHRPAVAGALSALAEAVHVASVSDPFQTGHVSAGGRIGYADITLDVPPSELGRASAAALAAALAPADAGGLTAELGGDAAFLNDDEASGAEAVGVLAAVVILVVAFGTIVAALVPVALALIAVAVGLSGVALLAAALDVSTAAPTFGAMIGLGVGIDYALFIASRYRENRGAGAANAEALAAAMGSSGTAVVFAGGTVVVSMAALALTGVGFLTSIGLATSIIVLVAVGTATTLLPALLSLLGNRVDAGRLLGRRRPAKPAEATAWWRLAHHISARPWRPRRCRCGPASPAPGTTRRAPATAGRTTCSPRASAPASTPRCSSWPISPGPGWRPGTFPSWPRASPPTRTSPRWVARAPPPTGAPSYCPCCRRPRRPTRARPRRSSGSGT